MPKKRTVIEFIASLTHTPNNEASFLQQMRTHTRRFVSNSQTRSCAAMCRAQLSCCHYCNFLYFYIKIYICKDFYISRRSAKSVNVWVWYFCIYEDNTTAEMLKVAINERFSSAAVIDKALFPPQLCLLLYTHTFVCSCCCNWLATIKRLNVQLYAHNYCSDVFGSYVIFVVVVFDGMALAALLLLLLIFHCCWCCCYCGIYCRCCCKRYFIIAGFIIIVFACVVVVVIIAIVFVVVVVRYWFDHFAPISVLFSIVSRSNLLCLCHHCCWRLFTHSPTGAAAVTMSATPLPLPAVEILREFQASITLRRQHCLTFLSTRVIPLKVVYLSYLYLHTSICSGMCIPKTHTHIYIHIDTLVCNHAALAACKLGI